MTRSPLRYPGGKSLFVDVICPVIGGDFDEYREPFCGGASIFFRMKQLFPDRKFWINDLFEDLFLFWTELRDDPESLYRIVEIYRTKNVGLREVHAFIRERGGSLSKAERAACFFVMNRISFSGTLFSGGFSQAYASARFTKAYSDRLVEASRVMCGAKVTNLDYEDVVTSPSDGRCVLYLDPPYLSATDSKLYGMNGGLHLSFDHARFASVMKECPHRWVCSYDDSEEVRRAFSFANVVPFQVKYGLRSSSSSEGKVGRELLIANFDFSLPEKVMRDGEREQ